MIRPRDVTWRGVMARFMRTHAFFLFCPQCCRTFPCFSRSLVDVLTRIVLIGNYTKNILLTLSLFVSAIKCLTWNNYKLCNAVDLILKHNQTDTLLGIVRYMLFIQLIWSNHVTSHEGVSWPLTIRQKIPNIHSPLSALNEANLTSATQTLNFNPTMHF
jgi:hypothetical protein